LVKAARRGADGNQTAQEIPDRRLRVARVVLWVSLLGLIAHLIDGDKPWSGGIAERVADDLPIRAIDYARTYRWWISLGSAVLVAALLATLRRWIGSPRAAECPELAAPDHGGGRAVAGVAALAMLTAALMAAPRLDFPFWADDERNTVRFSVDGEYVRGPEGDLVFREVSWRDTWLYTVEGPNNHVPFSLLARLSLGGWRALAKPELRFASERAVRLPAFAFGIAAIGALAWCLWRVGLPWAAGFAAIFLSIHPWHLRYASEARGYSLLLLCMPLILGAMVAVLHRGTWKRWIAFGLLEVIVFWVHPPGGLSILGVANAALLFELWRRHRGALREPAARWLVTNLAAAALFMLLMGANLFIFLWHYPWTTEAVNWRLIRDVLSHLWVGTAFSFGHASEHYAELADVARQAPVFFRIALAATGALCLLGAVRLVTRAKAGASLLAVLLLPAPLMVFAAQLRESLVNVWYVIFALPSFAILLGAGLEGLFAWLPRPGRAAATVAVMLAYLSGYAWLSHDVLSSLRSVPIQQWREVILTMRPSLDPFARENRDIITVSWQLPPVYYDPNVHKISEREQLLALLEEADRTGRQLYVSSGRPWLARRKYPELVKMVEREDLFEPVATFYGFQQPGFIQVYRYRGR